MSLTEHLRTADSPVRVYLDGVSPWLADTQGNSRESRSMAQALGLVGLASSKTLVPPVQGVDMARSGTAIDYRARIALGDFDPNDSAAALGMALLPLHVGMVDNGEHRARVLTEAFDMATRILSAPSDEAEIDRACLLLAHCEQVYRAGAAALSGSLGEALDTAKDGLAFALGIDDSSLADLRLLMTSNSAQISRWQDLIAAGERFEPNPSFSGSEMVGGADADWIVGDALIDSKAYAKLSVGSLRGFLRQLLGYVMLDLDDALSIRTVGVWLPRQGRTRTWPLGQLIGGNPEELLPRLREGFRSAAGNKQVATRELVSQRRKHQLLAENKHTPRRWLVDLALSDDVDIRFRVGRNAATPEETIRKLARDRYAKAREGVARNENAPVDLLMMLSTDSSVGVRRAVAANPRTPKEKAKVIGTEQNEHLRSSSDATASINVIAHHELEIDQTRSDDGLDTQWFGEFLMIARGELPWGRSPRLPVPEASWRWAFQEGRSLEVPDWLKAGLPEVVRRDLMLEHRPAWVRRTVAGDYPVSDPIVRDLLLTDIDPEIRWSALKRTVDWPDDSLAEMLGKLASDRKARTRFRTEGDGRSARERSRTPAEYERETLSLVASHPSTPQSALTALQSTKSPDVLIGLAENPALTADSQARLVPQIMAIKSHEIRARLASSRKLAPTVALSLADDRDPGVRAALAGNEIASHEVIEKLSKDVEPLTRLAVLANPATPSELAIAIAKVLLTSSVDTDLLDVLHAVDRHDDLEMPADLLSDALERLSKSRVREPDLRRIAASDERAAPETLARLSRSADEFVRLSVAKNPSAPTEVLFTLAADSDPSVRASCAANEALDTRLLQVLAHDEAVEVRSSAARSPRLEPSLLSALLRDDERAVRSAAYRNPSTPPEEKAKIDAEQERAWIDSAPSRAELVELVANKRAEVRMGVAFDSRTPPDVLSMLGGERRSARVRRAVAANPNTPAEVLASLADDRDVEVRQAVAFNGSTPLDVLARLAGRSVDLALLIALNPDAPVRILDALADDEEPLVKFIAAEARADRAALTMGEPHTKLQEILP